MSNIRKIDRNKIFRSLNKILETMQLHPQCHGSSGSMYHNLPEISLEKLVLAEAKLLRQKGGTNHNIMDYIDDLDSLETYPFNRSRLNNLKKFVQKYKISRKGMLPDWFNSIQPTAFRSIVRGNDTLGSILAKRESSNEWEVERIQAKEKVFLFTSGQKQIQNSYHADIYKVQAVNYQKKGQSFTHYTALSEKMPYHLDFCNILPFPRGMKPILHAKYYEEAQRGYYAVPGVTMYMQSTEKDILYYQATFYTGNQVKSPDNNLKASLTNDRLICVSFSYHDDLLIIDLKEPISSNKPLHIDMQSGRDFVHIRNGKHLIFHHGNQYGRNFYDFANGTGAEFHIHDLKSYQKAHYPNGDICYYKHFRQPNESVLYIRNYTAVKHNIRLQDVSNLTAAHISSKR